MTVRFAVALAFSILATSAWPNSPLRIYIDADFSNHSESSLSIRRGIETALSTVGYQAQGRTIQIVVADHRGNTRRSKHHIREFLEDDNALIMFSGIHSPPMIANRDFINENSVLYFVPWAAAGSITRPKTDANWIFRLSVDDTKAGRYLVDYAVSHGKYQRPLLLLENTAWGRFNRETMAAELENLGVKFDVQWFDWNIGRSGAFALAQKARLRGNDTVLLVANALEGSALVNAFAGSGIPIVSHWGITGGSFHEKVKHETRETLSLRFLQTRFSFLASPLTDYQHSVLENAIKLWPEYASAQDIRAPTGFVHAHDLTMILLAAMQQVNLDENIGDIRAEVHKALEALPQPVEGLVKTYDEPFRPYSPDQPDAHEALDSTEFAIGKYGSEDQIVLIEWVPGSLE